MVLLTITDFCTCQSRYKRAIRTARASFQHQVSDKLATRLLQGDMKSFWNKWNTKFGARYLENVNIEGSCDPSSRPISQRFVNFFECNLYNFECNLLLKNCFLRKI